VLLAAVLSGGALAMVPEVARAQPAPAPAAAAPQPEPEARPPVRLDPVVVTPGRFEQRASEAPASVTVITRRDIERSASQTVDDLLRQVPGFSLFRRTSSVVGHPTTQGVSLRGIGPSGTSRALVLLDDVPVNDPFGGWVYWNRIPLLGLGQVEVVRGGGSAVWGNYALGGVVHLRTERPTERAVAAEASGGNRGTWNLDGLVHEVWGPLRLALEGNAYSTDGYRVVKTSRRGRIDVPADSRHATFHGRLEWQPAPDLSLFASGAYYDEERGNGTPLQINDTRSGSWALGGRLRDGGGGQWTATLFGQDQRFRSTFSTQALDRNAETLALDQTVPAVSAGGAVGWSRRVGPHRLLAGADLRWVEGETDEEVFVAGAFARRRVAGGEQLVAGAYLQDAFTPSPDWEIVGGVRLDYWVTYTGSRRDVPPPAGVPLRQDFDDADQLAASPRLAVLWRPWAGGALRASAYQAFRAPTLNELYRVFRVRNDVTAANPRLRPERLTGGELGLQQRWGPVEVRLTGFWNDVEHLILNVTRTARLPDCPPGTTCRQRQNVDLGRIRGVETDVEWVPARGWRLLASHLFTDARVEEAPQQRALEGKRLAQVPEQTYTLGLRWEDPRLVNVGVTGRFVGRQFEDDLNTLPLGSVFVVDVFLSRAVARWGEVFVAVENLLDETYATGRTSEGVISIGAPRLVRGGLRVTF
jgi:outer membrane receptor protein involved in Fe transport